MSKTQPFDHLGQNLQIKYINCIDLKPYKNNPRTHSKKQVAQIVRSMEQFGWTNPVLIDEKKNIIAGHGRLEAAKLIGISKVPIIELAHLSNAQKKAYVIADNKLAENAGWDDELLAIEIKDLIDLDFDIEITGFEMGEIDFLIDGTINEDLDPADEIIEPDTDKPAITKPGDLWVLGKHKLYCGNSLEEDSYFMLMGHEQAEVVFTDPPYNVPIDGHVCGKGSIKHREFEMAAGEMSEDQFTDFLTQYMKLSCSYSKAGAISFHCMDWRHMGELLHAGRTSGCELKNLCVWVKDNGGMGSLYRSRHELVFVFKHGDGKHINNVELGKHGRNRTNVWEYSGINSMRAGRMEELAMHPTVKPINLVADAIKDCSKRGGIILDPFGGSGTTLISAEKTGRVARLIELDPHYCDVIVQRWEKLTGKKAVKEESDDE